MAQQEWKYRSKRSYKTQLKIRKYQVSFKTITLND